MDMLERFLGHDADTTRKMLALCLALTDEQMDRDFDAGWRTLRRTFNHMIGNVEGWTDLMVGRPVRQEMDRESVSDLIERHERSYAEFAAFAHQIEREERLDELWTDTLDVPPAQKSFGGAIGHVITHNMHHRSELLHIFHRLGMENLPEGDLMGWDQRRRLAGD